MAKQTGVALILVLFFSAILSATLIVYQYRQQSLLSLSNQANDYVAARAELLSIKEELKFTLATSPLWFNGVSATVLQQHNLPAGFNFWGRPFSWHNARVTITDASGLLSVLPYEANQWRHTLKGLNIAKADNIVDELSDWIDNDSFIHFNGAEQQDYGVETTVRNDVPQSVDELRMLRSMDAQTWQTLIPFISYFGHGQFSTEYLPDALLTPVLGEYRAELVTEQRDASSVNKIELNNAVGDSISAQYPSTRLRVEISSAIGEATYQESFTLVRGLGTKQFLFETETKAGFSNVE